MFQCYEIKFHTRLDAFTHSVSGIEHVFPLKIVEQLRTCYICYGKSGLKKN